MFFCNTIIYGIIIWFGADIAFDRRTLTDYFASRPYTLRIFLIVANVTKAVKEVPAVFAQAFTQAFAPKTAAVLA